MSWRHMGSRRRAPEIPPTSTCCGGDCDCDCDCDGDAATRSTGKGRSSSRHAHACTTLAGRLPRRRAYGPRPPSALRCCTGGNGPNMWGRPTARACQRAHKREGRRELRCIGHGASGVPVTLPSAQSPPYKGWIGPIKQPVCEPYPRHIIMLAWSSSPNNVKHRVYTGDRRIYGHSPRCIRGSLTRSLLFEF